MAKKGFWSDFKDFAMKGNVIDMAVGVVIGGAFGKIIASLVNDIIMPLVGTLLGGFDFKSLSVTLPSWASAAEDAEPAVLNYGNFLQECVDFIIIALCIFLFIRAIAKAKELKKKEEEAAPAEPAAPAPKPDDVVLLEEIRDLLKAKK